MEFIRPDGLVDIAKLGLTLAEGKQLLAQVQQEVVAAQADNHAMLRPDCRSCGGRCHVKNWRPHRIATLFGEVRVRLPRFLCAGQEYATGFEAGEFTSTMTHFGSHIVDVVPRIDVRDRLAAGKAAANPWHDHIRFNDNRSPKRPKSS
jgi:hypothetical protein